MSCRTAVQPSRAAVVRRAFFVIINKNMKEECISPEQALLKTVFESRSWDIYTERSHILASQEPHDWESVKFPLEVAAELTNHCNLRCVMCPVPALRRKRGFMDEALFDKVISELSAESGFLFLPQGFGESLLHTKWFHFMDSARSLQIRPIIVLTNGMLLREDRVPSLIKCVDIVVVTIDGSTAETYESVRVNGDLSVVTANVETFLKTRGDAATPHLIMRMIRMRDTEKEVEAFRALWSGKVAQEDIIQISDCIDWAGTVPYRGLTESRSQEQRHACRMLWKNLTVLHDGRVTPCCYDAEGELVVGNVLDQSLREIWNGRSLHNLRDSHLSCQFNRIPLCSHCRNWH